MVSTVSGLDACAFATSYLQAAKSLSNCWFVTPGGIMYGLVSTQALSASNGAQAANNSEILTENFSIDVTRSLDKLVIGLFSNCTRTVTTLSVIDLWYNAVSPTMSGDGIIAVDAKPPSKQGEKPGECHCALTAIILRRILGKRKPFFHND